MNRPDSEPTEPTEPSAPLKSKKAPSKRHRAVDALRGAIDHADPGTLAALRRADPASPPATFYRITVDILDGILPESGDSRDESERRWVVVVSSMARAKDLLAPVPLGQAIAQAGVAEMRFLRLLEAHGDQLADVVRNVVHQLVQKAQPFESRQLADLVLSDGTKHERAPRRRIARDFYRHEGN